MAQTVPTSYGVFTQKELLALKGTIKGAFDYILDPDTDNEMYWPVNMDDINIGANIYLEFKPNSRVIDAKRMGFVQTARGSVTVDEGKGKGPEEQVPEKERWRNPVMTQSGSDKWTFIDQDQGRKNPLYATAKQMEEPTSDKTKKDQANSLSGYKDASDKNNPAGVADLNLLPENKRGKYTRDGSLKNRKWYGSGSFGHRYADSKAPNGFAEKDATFQDAPHILDFYDKASQKFETTVLVVDGTQKGLYLGSVKWGWERELNRTTLDADVRARVLAAQTANALTDAGSGTRQAKKEAKKKENKDADAEILAKIKTAANDAFTLTPITFESAGAPSEIFFDAAKQWNTPGKGRSAESTIDLPMSQVSVKTDKAKLYGKKEDINTPTSSEIKAGGQWRFIESTTVGSDEYVFIRCFEGDHKGTSGWMKRDDVNLGEMDKAVTK